MVRLVVFIWLGVALAVGATGALRRSPIPPPGIAVALTIAALLVIRISPRARAGVHNVGPGPFVLFHLVRIAAGAYFLVLGARGVLPNDVPPFQQVTVPIMVTVPQGVGDYVVNVEFDGRIAFGSVLENCTAPV